MRVNWEGLDNRFHGDVSEHFFLTGLQIDLQRLKEIILI
jgi:hypothetical protein